MEEACKDPVSLSEGINLRDLMSSGAEFHIDTDFKKKPKGQFINGDDDLFPDLSDEDDSDSDDVLKNIEESTAKMMLSSPEYHSFEELAAKMIDCVSGGKVKILIVEEGEGPLVPTDAEVTIHYAAYWERAKIPFDSSLTMNYGSPITLQLGLGRVLPGLELGITMVRGPAARFLLLVAPEAAWGNRGAPPRIRPEHSLFVVSLQGVTYSHAPERFNDLPSEEQAKFETTSRTVNTIHIQGKDLFTKHRYFKAIKTYQQAISVLNLSRPLTDDEVNEVRNLKIKSYINLAMCYYKINKPKLIIRMLEALESHADVDKHCKALFYYGRAYEQLGKHDEAFKYYNRALKLEPKNKDIGNALHKLDVYLKESSKKEKSMWLTAFKNEEKEESKDVDDTFRSGVRDMIEELCNSKEYAKFDLPAELTTKEVDFVKELTKDFKNLLVQEDGEGRRKKVTVIKRMI